MRFLVALVLLLSFGSCWSLNDGGLASVKCKETLVKDPLGALLPWRDGGGEVNPCSDGERADFFSSRRIGFHRKLLGRLFNPYTTLVGNRPVATATPSASSVPPRKDISAPPPIAPKSSTVPVPPRKDVSAPPPYVPLTNSSNPKHSTSSSNNKVAVVAGCIGGAVFLLLLVTGVFFFRSKAGKSVNPWRTGLSGQLQKVFVTGVPKLKRPEIEAASEDFSNVIGSCPIGTLFKGTLSSGVEIAVASVAAKSAKDWNDNLEMQFRKKIETLSKTNHKNFVNLLGFCEDDEPFTRIMVFEYAPNGTLFEHLHFEESEHLDWGMRLRIVMGTAYCLDHMHQLNPPIAHSNLVSSSIQLTEDYAVKIADFTFGNQKGPSETESSTKTLIDKDVSVTTPEDNVFRFGVLLFEIMTGRLPYSVNNSDSVDNRLADYLRGGENLREMADPTLEAFDEKIENIGEVIKSCVQADPKQRPTMREATARLREITGISPDEAIPKLSPLWWAELEVLSTA